MTLKDKFDNPIMRHNLGRNEIEETKEQCVEIAEGFAIGFAEWCDKTTTQVSKGEWGNWLPIAKYCLSTKELLEIYKKQL